MPAEIGGEAGRERHRRDVTVGIFVIAKQSGSQADRDLLADQLRRTREQIAVELIENVPRYSMAWTASETELTVADLVDNHGVDATALLVSYTRRVSGA